MTIDTDSCKAVPRQ